MSVSSVGDMMSMKGMTGRFSVSPKIVQLVFCDVLDYMAL